MEYLNRIRFYDEHIAAISLYKYYRLLLSCVLQKWYYKFTYDTYYKFLFLKDFLLRA